MRKLFAFPAHLEHLGVVFIRWTFLRAIFHRGWWLATTLYLVVEAQLTPLQLVTLGTAQGVTVVIFEVPAGVVADTVSRKWSIVLAHLLMGIAMLATGLVTSFQALLMTQMLWGLSWTLSSGADVAWLTDELKNPEHSPLIIGAAARWGQIGAAAGLIGVGLVAWATTLSTAMIIAGSAMLALGIYVLLAFPEHNFVRQSAAARGTVVELFTKGMAVARLDRAVGLLLAITFVINGADEVFSRLFAKRLIELGLPEVPHPVLWLTLLGLATLATGAIALQVVESRLNDIHRRGLIFRVACGVGCFGLLLFALAPNHWVAMAGVILVHGIAWNITRVISIIWMNNRVEGEIRATMQSMLAQAENLGEVCLGFSLAVVAQLLHIPAAIIGAALLVLFADRLIRQLRAQS